MSKTYSGECCEGNLRTYRLSFVSLVPVVAYNGVNYGPNGVAGKFQNNRFQNKVRSLFFNYFTFVQLLTLLYSDYCSNTVSLRHSFLLYSMY